MGMTKPRKRRQTPAFDAQKFLDSVGATKQIITYEPLARIFGQGDPATTVMYIQQGTVKLSVVSETGREAVVAVLGSGDFFGEGCLAGQPIRMGTVTAMTAVTVLVLDKAKMIHMLHKQSAFSDRFITHMLARNIRVEEDLVDQISHSSEKRLARALLLLARYSKQEKPELLLPNLSQEFLAEMVGTTRSRVNFFMNKFRKLGFIEYNGGLKINSSLLSVVLHD